MEKTEEKVCEIIKKRTTIRSFIKKEIPQELLDEILQVVQSCPTAGNLQGFKVYVVKKQEIKKKLSESAWSQKHVLEADVVLVFFAYPQRSSKKYGQRGQNLYCYQDATIACSYAQIAAHALGLSSGWVGAFNDDEIKKICNAEDELIPVAMLPLGYVDPESKKKAEEKGKSRLPQEEIVHFL
ncbi:nad(p)h nitroreductase ydgi-related [Anaeramoeba ignava]|uniref:Nad(P)h nitroreductase ydgi-related n=1 Tax=Anaeramoeba ignava TaxID=1746090 RepID=A0A9Q0RI21_ANAIG|nr:nad(p)h nitroreductase ydgi-related [Anaeramoeba ignava]KAJ5080739.1 nad(p)h nitroreductase ydgi-related [Anaeramoeba ignava]